MSQLEEVKNQIKQALPELDMVIGWEQGYDALHATPLFVTKEQDLDKLIWNPLCVHNLATYLPSLKGKKVGVVVKGCDSRSVIELLQEELIERENIKVFALPCSGTISITKIRRQIGDKAFGTVESVNFEGKSAVIKADGQEHRLDLDAVLADKCLRCQYPNPLIADFTAGQEQQPKEPKGGFWGDLDEFIAKPEQEKFEFWKQEMSRCIRCYACRNACPMCVCRDHCVATSRDPHLLSQEASLQEKWMFQVVHAMHLAGRCTECGECERACPVDIPILMFKRQLNKAVKEVFDYEAGTDEKATPPVYTFKVEEPTIKERL